MFLSSSKFGKIGVSTLILIVVMAATAWGAQGSDRSSDELERDLRASNLELSDFESLQSKLSGSARQSSNTARQSVIADLQVFMGECIVRREGDLGNEMTIKQHGKNVESGTTDVADVGTPVAVKNSGSDLGVYSSSNGDRVRQLSNMKSIYIGAKNSGRLASEKQTDAFERYSETIAEFGDQLQWSINSLEKELQRREHESKAKEEEEEAEETATSQNM